MNFVSCPYENTWQSNLCAGLWDCKKVQRQQPVVYLQLQFPFWQLYNRKSYPATTTDGFFSSSGQHTIHGQMQKVPRKQSQVFHPQYLVEDATTTVGLLFPCIFPPPWLFRFCSRAAILALVSASRRISFFNFSSSKSRFMSSSFADGAVATGRPSTWTLSVDCEVILTASKCESPLGNLPCKRSAQQSPSTRGRPQTRFGVLPECTASARVHLYKSCG